MENNLYQKTNGKYVVWLYKQTNYKPPCIEQFPFLITLSCKESVGCLRRINNFRNAKLYLFSTFQLSYN